ncbi:MAG TPA: BrnA antitoxin family protein [Candidatus Hydrogenedentes bacterium]|nr:BrnA antitoxin family protein [Candidatus Hydrogenedentota bacterium]
MKNDEIDLSDIPEIDPKVFDSVEVRLPKPKELISMRLDPDVLAWFRDQGSGYQTRINAVLRAYIKSQAK